MTTWVLATMLAVVQPRLLGPSAQGELRLAFSLWTIAQVIIGLGTALFLTLEIAHDRVRGLGSVGPVLVLRTIAFVVSSAVLAAYLVIVDADGGFVAIMAVFGLSTFFVAMTDAFIAVFVGLERMSVLAKATIIAKVVGTVAAIAVLLAGGQALAVVIVLAAANLLGMLILVASFRAVASIRLRGWRADARRILVASSAFLLAGVVLTTYQQLDTVIMSLLVDNDALGWYSTADTLFGSLLFLPTIVMGSIFPVIGRLFRDDPAAIEPLVRRASSLLVMVGVPIGLGTMVVAIPLAPLLYGNAFRETGQVLTVLGTVVVFTFGTIVFGMVALATGRQRFWNTIMVLAIAITIPLDLIFVPWADRTYGNGAIGGAMAYVVTEALMFALGLWKVAPYLVERAFIWWLARVLIAGGLMFMVSWPLRDEPLIIPIAVGAVVYVAAIVVLRVPEKDDLLRLRSMISRSRGPVI
jgi:O-antigen/teichoic acid export membrane protein